MMIFTHVVIGVLSLGFTTYLLLAPEKAKLITSYALFALTILSGILLVVSQPGVLIHACVSGVIYSSLVLSGTFVAQRKLAYQENR